jgi:hypothetical protein
MMKRLVQPEWLDEMPATAREAIGSRRDLQRLNTWMAHPRLAWKALHSIPLRGPAPRLAELGAGDGTFLLGVARRLGNSWRGTAATLVDRQSLVAAETVRGFSDLGWRVQFCRSDVFDWCVHSGTERFDAVLANLFLHHFGQGELRKLLQLIRRRSHGFIAIEPRRSLLSLAFSNLVGFIGCNAVTRHDAPVSVQAGFSGRELSRLFNGNGEWTVRERAAGPFSHLFCARKKSGRGFERV